MLRFTLSGKGRLYLKELGVLKGKFLYVVANFVWVKDSPSHAMFSISDLDGNYSRVRRP